jgi:hypothetical protein
VLLLDRSSSDSSGATNHLLRVAFPWNPETVHAYSGIMRTPIVKRLPVVLALAASLIVAQAAPVATWLAFLVFVTMLAGSALFLHFIVGLPWARIVSYREYE